MPPQLLPFSALEMGLISAIALAVLFCAFRVVRSRQITSTWNPLGMFGALYAFYFILGPVIAVYTGKTSIAPIEYRQYYVNGWMAGAVGIWATIVGFCLFPAGFVRRWLRPSDKAMARGVGWWFCVFGAVAMIGFIFVVDQIGFSPTSAKHNEEYGIFAMQTNVMWGYLYYSINVAISVLGVWIVSALRPVNYTRLIVLGVAVAICLIIYAKIGFRSRIVVLAVTLLVCFYRTQRKRPSAVTLVAWVMGILIMASVIVVTRRNFTSLDLESLGDESLASLSAQAFQDSVTFSTLSLVIDTYPRENAYIGLQPLWAALVLPIPRGLWPDKPSPRYIEAFFELTGTGGQAVPNIGEYYMSAGWIGIILGSLLVGFAYKVVWQWGEANRDSKLGAVVYALAYAMIFPLVSRGYLGQLIQEAVFTFGPVGVALWIWRARSGKSIGAKLAP